MCESHACRLKTSISRIEDNFSRLTHKSGQAVIKTLDFISDLLSIISLLFVTIANTFKCLQSVWIESVQRSSEYLQTFSVMFGSLWKIVGSGSDVFGDPGHDETKISCIWLRKSWQVYSSSSGRGGGTMFPALQSNAAAGYQLSPGACLLSKWAMGSSWWWGSRGSSVFRHTVCWFLSE